MKPWLIVDVESTGTDPKADRLVEVGAVLFDPELGIPVRAESVLIGGEGNAAEQINRIPAAALRGTWCVNEGEADARIWELAQGCDYILAHQASFDRAWFPEDIQAAPWICTYTQAEWPRGAHGTLASIALSLDLGVARAHRAIEDCLLLAAILTRTHEIESGLDAWLARAIEPRSEVIALVSYEQRELAKNTGFRWDPDRRLWVRSVRTSQVDAVTKQLGFRTRVAA